MVEEAAEHVDSFFSKGEYWEDVRLKRIATLQGYCKVF